MLQRVWEEDIAEERAEAYYEDLYRVVCVSERLANRDHDGKIVRTTYIVDWEQLVHLLEDYDGFGEDIVELARMPADEARMWLKHDNGQLSVARA